MSRGYDVRAPLFDRLVDRDPHSRREAGNRPLRTLDREGLRESVRRELLRLFSSRVSLPASRLAGRERTAVDYGIPDFATFTPGSNDDRVRLAAVLRRAVAAFEPRLRRVAVTVEEDPGDHLALVGRVSGVLVVDEVEEPVAFPTVFHAGTGKVEVHGGI